MEQQYRDEMRSIIDNLNDGGAFERKATFLFGHCNATEELADYLITKDIIPAAILDNNVSKQGLLYRDIPIISPHAIASEDIDSSIVLIATRYFAEMSAQLRCFGYNGEIVRAVDYDSFTEFSLSDETIGRKKARMLRGVQILRRIRESYPEEHLIVCPNNALGDVYWAMAFLPAYCIKRRISKAAAIVTGNGCLQVAEMFGAERIYALNNSEMDELVQALIFTNEENCTIAHHDRPYTDSIIKYLNKRFLSFIDYYRYAVYGLPIGTKPTTPGRLLPIPESVGLVANKSVVIAPYAKSVIQPPASFWAKIAGQWQSRGFAVFTSVNTDEQPIGGTAPLSLPLNQMISAVEHAGVFIGLRNGMCDIVHTAQCRKIVVFPDCYYSTTPHKVIDFFGLPGWEIILQGNHIT